LRLTRFKYLKRQRVLTLTLIVILSSMLFSLAALSLLGFYRGFTAYLGEGEDVIVVYNPKCKTPITSSVPAYLAEKLAVLGGVLASSPEAMAPCLVNDEAVFLRGIIPESFVKVNPITIVEGSPLDLTDTGSVIVGVKAAEKLGLQLNQKLLFQGVLADEYAELEVKGIFKSDSIMDDEVLAPLHVGQWLRGMDYDSVTIIRLKIDRTAVTASEIFEAVKAEAEQPSSQPSQGQESTQEPIMPWAMRYFSLEEVGVEEASKLMKSYMERYGVTEEALLALSATVFLFSSLTIILASKTVVTQHKGEINILRSIGASRRLLKIDIMIKLLPSVLAASTMGMLTASAILTVIQGFGHLQVLSHTVPFNLEPALIALNLILPAALVSISVLREKL